MASKVQILLIDDIDQSGAVETISFALDGVTYEIDLSERNAAKMRRAFAPYVDASRRVSAARKVRKPRTRRVPAHEAAE